MTSVGERLLYVYLILVLPLLYDHYGLSLLRADGQVPCLLTLSLFITCPHEPACQTLRSPCGRGYLC